MTIQEEIIINKLFSIDNLIIADVDFNSSRYEIVINYDKIDKSVVISVPNLFVSMRTNCIMKNYKALSIEYKLLERDILPGDAFNIETIVNKLVNDCEFFK